MAAVAVALLAFAGAASADVTRGSALAPQGADAAISAQVAGREAKPKTVVYSRDWLKANVTPEGGKDWQCLTEAIYFEARGEGLKGQFAVAEVILNRRDSGLYPASVCGVVRQRGGGGCQFSYVCDGIPDVMRDRQARDLAGRIARVMLDGAERSLTKGATHFHTKAVRPAWAKRFSRTAEIGSHQFYRHPSAKRG